MANPLRKTMVYLGLADEEYDDVMPSAPVAPVSRQDRMDRQERHEQPKRAEALKRRQISILHRQKLRQLLACVPRIKSFFRERRFQ